MSGAIASRMTWVFGTDPDKNLGAGTHGPHNNVVGSTGAGAAFNTHGYGAKFTFYMETNDSGWAYQIRTGRTSSGPWTVLSSNSGVSTAALDTFQTDGPFAWLSPRQKAMASTGNFVILRMTAVE